MNRIALCLGLLFSLGLASACPRTAHADTSRTEVTVYAEEGLWYVHLFTLDPAGWTDTLERQAYPTETEARDRARELTTRIGAEEIDPTPKDAAPAELRTPLAGEIWTATQEWSEDWETQFAKWIYDNADKKFFKRYNIETDCADVAVALRWIFARINKLPAGNRLMGDSSLMTNRSVRSVWRDLPTNSDWSKDRRFRAALDYVMINTYTHSINADSYPIEIDPKYLTEGSFHLELRKEDGHTRVVNEVIHDGSAVPVWDIYSTVPRKVRKLVQEGFSVPEQPPLNSGGFRRHRWVRLTADSASLVPAEALSGYSIEQYQPEFFKHGFNDFSAEVSMRMAEGFDPVTALDTIYDNISTLVDERKTVVEQGWEVCSKEDCSPGTGNYENWSTPARDQRLLSYFQQVQNYLKTLYGDDLERFKSRYEKIQKKKLVKLFGKKRTYGDIEALWGAGKYSSNPKDPPNVRWGIPASDSQG